MRSGYTKPLYLLPFDHRGSYLSGMFHLKEPLTADDHAKVARSKRLIYDGFRQALAGKVPPGAGGILVDEEFGSDILRDAGARCYVTALSVEKSGSDEFEFEYGDAFAAHLETFNPTFAKVLVRYNPEGDAALNQRKTARLRRLSEHCRSVGQRFMFELLVPATQAQTSRLATDGNAYDLQLRPELMRQTIRTLQDAGVEPDVWKIEGLELREDCEKIVETAQRGGRGDIGCIVLGRGADEARVIHWLQTAASVSGFIGFAVGRTTFWDAVAGFEAKALTRQDAVSHIAKRYGEWVEIYEKARQSLARYTQGDTKKIANGGAP
ncbi:MAG TPA: DUF2090 domain-containing protein [Stenotrophobium sp.]|nr:DUF2090 domain-containing protein [Stenotrophobium sp.]